MGGGTYFKVGGTSARQKNAEKFELATVTIIEIQRHLLYTI